MREAHDVPRRRESSPAGMRLTAAVGCWEQRAGSRGALLSRRACLAGVSTRGRRLVGLLLEQLRKVCRDPFDLRGHLRLRGCVAAEMTAEEVVAEAREGLEAAVMMAVEVWWRRQWR